MDNVSNYPDAKYGNFFETAIKAFSDAAYEDIVKEDDFWIKQQGIADTSENLPQERFNFLVLTYIDKKELVPQINAIFAGITPSPVPTKEQSAAIKNAKDTFFDGF
jgi:hypothetical protein